MERSGCSDLFGPQSALNLRPWASKSKSRDCQYNAMWLSITDKEVQVRFMALTWDFSLVNYSMLCAEWMFNVLRLVMSYVTLDGSSCTLLTAGQEKDPPIEHRIIPSLQDTTL